MKHIKTLNTRNLQNTVKKGGCGECQTSCQSACKTSCTVGNRAAKIQNKRKLSYAPRRGQQLQEGVPMPGFRLGAPSNVVRNPRCQQ